jgi:hypothetical protein
MDPSSWHLELATASKLIFVLMMLLTFNSNKLLRNRLLSRPGWPNMMNEFTYLLLIVNELAS